MNLTEAFEVLIKGRKMDVGAITTRANGVQYQKQGDGKWVEYKGGAKKQGAEETDLKGDIKEAFMYSVDDYKLGQPPQEDANPVKLELGVFDMVEAKDSSGKVFYSIHDPYHGLFLESAYTKKEAISKANKKLKDHNAFTMADIQELTSKVAKSNQKIAIEEADRDSKFSEAISQGRMTYKDAIKILESAGIKNYRDKNLDNYNPKKPKKTQYENDYKSANIITTSELSNKDICKYMAVAGVPKGFDGEVYVDEGTYSIQVRADNSDIYMKRKIGVSGRDKGVIENLEFRIRNNNVYNGTDVFYNQVKNASKEGFNKIETQAYRAQGWNGYYTWLRLGYKPNDGEDIEFVENANFELGTNVKSITELMYSQEGRDYWKKNGESFYANFDLSKNSYSMKTLEEYVKNKNK